VVHEQFLTDTTDYANIVLPATTFFEHKDLVQAYGHYYLQVSHQAMEPLGECKSNVDFFASWRCAWASMTNASASRWMR